MEVAVKLAFEELYVQLVPAGVQRPVDGVKIIARRIVAITRDLSSAAGQLLSLRSQERTTAGPPRLEREQFRSLQQSGGKQGHGTER